MRPLSLTWVGRFSILRSWIEVVTAVILNDSAYVCRSRASQRHSPRRHGGHGDMRILLLGLILPTLAIGSMSGQDTTKLSEADAAAIKATALDYAQGW